MRFFRVIPQGRDNGESIIDLPKSFCYPESVIAADPPRLEPIELRFTHRLGFFRGLGRTQDGLFAEH
jgi:hypothetical protein